MKISHFIHVLLMDLVLSACSGSTTRVFEDKEYRDPKNCVLLDDNEMDDFKIVSFDTNNCASYLDRNPDMYAFPRAVIDKKTSRVTYQVYIFVHGQEWYFLKSYRYLLNGSLEPARPLVEIDRSIGSGIREDHVFDVPKKHFQQFTKSSMKIRLYGQRKNSEVAISPELFEQVLNAVELETKPTK